MKKIFLLTLIISIFLFSGCQSKGNEDNSLHVFKGNSQAQPKNSESSDGVMKTTVEGTISKEKIDNNKYNFQPLQAGTLNQLSEAQKVQISKKFSSAISNINSSLNSLEDVKDIDLSSVN